MMVWFGVQEALALRRGSGFNMAKFMNFFVLITCILLREVLDNSSDGYSLKIHKQGTSSVTNRKRLNKKSERSHALEMTAMAINRLSIR